MVFLNSSHEFYLMCSVISAVTLKTTTRIRNRELQLMQGRLSSPACMQGLFALWITAKHYGMLKDTEVSNHSDRENDYICID
jgi:hypothetical protein